mgnify:CR=1 FL=1
MSSQIKSKNERKHYIDWFRVLAFVLLLLFTSTSLFSQIQTQKKTLNITRIKNKVPKLDGVLDDDAWKSLEVANNFVMLKPNNGEKELDSHKTEVKVIYDDDAIYISAMMYDPDPLKIAMEFTNRDNRGQVDEFTVALNPNNDGLNSTVFKVLSTGTQIDAAVSNGREDGNWSAVWYSVAKINENGWSVEMKIPYSALRFSNQEIQTWGINFARKLINQDAEYSWNHIDNTKGVWTQYDGILKGIRNIDPPTRLSFYPHASTTASHYDGVTEYSQNIGMDLKYGITENFTLDLTLIPDFGQTAFDNVTLNLGPFEQQFSEQRQFFTEGIELFNKGRLFYSRRIGNRPIDYYSIDDNLAANEEITDNPGKVNMLNAVKISGRTKGGLGIGFFNAITDETKATIKKTVTQGSSTTEEFYQKVTEPFANYNVLVLDQQFNQNSWVTLVNTNAMREGEYRDANVTGLLYRVTTPSNSYFIDGFLKASKVNERGTKETGYSFDSSVAKISGNWHGEIGYNFEDDVFNINDLGFQSRNNKQTIYSNLSYRILKPVGNFNNFTAKANFSNNYLYSPGIYIGNNYQIKAEATTKKRLNFGVDISGNIGKQYNYFEPRRTVSEGHYLIRYPRMSTGAFISSDSRKKFAFNFSPYLTRYLGGNNYGYGVTFQPKYRFSNRFSFGYSFKFNAYKKMPGYVTDIDVDITTDLDNSSNPIIFGKRNTKKFENSLTGKYNFSTKSSLSLSFRHYWSSVKYENQFYSLKNDGNLENNSYTGSHDVNYNSWNLDVNYIWQFAPGSQLIAFYRNSIFNENDKSDLNFVNNLDDLFNQPALHTFSLKFVYYIDYNKLKNIF